MPLYGIKKLVKAKDIKDALKRERQCAVTEIWEERDSVQEKVIEGFTLNRKR